MGDLALTASELAEIGTGKDVAGVASDTTTAVVNTYASSLPAAPLPVSNTETRARVAYAPAETAVAARSFRKRTLSESNMNKQNQPEKRKRKVGLLLV